MDFENPVVTEKVIPLKRTYIILVVRKCNIAHFKDCFSVNK